MPGNLDLKLVKAPDNRLRIVTKPVKKIGTSHLAIIKAMIKLTKSFKDPEGVGLASTQVGLSEQYFVTKLDKGGFKAIFNPKILGFSKKTKVFLEGCLSIPNYWGEVTRPIGVTVEYMDETGKTHQEKLTGLEAWVFQHEVEHLEGKLFMDKVLQQKGRLYRVIGKDRAGNDVFEEIKV